MDFIVYHNNMNKNNNKFNNKKIKNNNFKETPPIKHKSSIKMKIDNNKENMKNKHIKNRIIKKQKDILNNIQKRLNVQKQFQLQSISDSKKTILISNNFFQTIDIKNDSKEENNLEQENNTKTLNIKSFKKQIIKKQIFDKKEEKDKNYVKNNNKVETTQGKNNNYSINFSVKNNLNKLSKIDSNIQDLDYEEAIIYDKRSFLQIYWGFLIDSQIILGTFCTGNNLDLFSIKLSFLVFTFQISFFLNSLFYTDEYISNAYHNDGVLDFFTGLPKSIYSFFATLITTNLLRMLSSSKSELMGVIRRNSRFQNYTNIINNKLSKLRKKLVVYFILLFVLESFFLYYVISFCAVYKNSQKYWFIGCLESFGMDSFVSSITCIFLALFRYISIKKHIKCFYIIANIINTLL